MLFIFKQENASEISVEGEEIASLAACNMEIVSNVAKTFVQTLDFSEMNGFSLTYDEVPSGNVFFTISENITSLTVVEGAIAFTQKFRSGAENHLQS